MKICKINKVSVDNIPVYDVVNVPKNHNFIVKTNNSYTVSHNCGML